MNKKPLVILGSARRESHTGVFVSQVFSGMDFQLVNLLDHTISPYRYEGDYPSHDTYQQLTDQMIRHQVIALATPVYWYSMSGLMKTVFDRFTDLVTLHKSVGRSLKGKQLLLIAVGTDAELPPGFEVPFEYTAGYLDMEYKGAIYRSEKYPVSHAEETSAIGQFINKIKI